MLESLRSFLLLRGELAWVLELSLCAAAWVILRFGAGEKARWYRVFGEFLILLLVMSTGFLSSVVLIFPNHYVPLLWGFLHGAIAYFYLRRFSLYRRKTRILLWLALYICCLSIMSMAGQASIVLGQFVKNAFLEGAVRSVVYVLIPLVSFYLRRFNFDDYPVVPKSGLRMLGTGAVCVLLLYVVEARYMTADYRVSVALLVGYLGLFTMSGTAIQSLHALCLEQNALLELQAEKSRFVAEREMTQMAESKLEDLRCIRHDLKNQYSYMQILLAEKRYDELQQYFAKLSENLPTQLNMIDCGNRTVNTVLNMELAKLRGDRISFEHQLVVPPVLPFPDEDVCAIITNLLDNAADECRRLLKNGRSSVKVRLEIYPHQSYLFIKCSNSTDRTELSRSKGGLRTTKEDEQMHGYGTRIITKLSEKYNGCADYSLADGQFVAQVMLDMTEVKSHENQDRAV